MTIPPVSGVTSALPSLPTLPTTAAESPESAGFGERIAGALQDLGEQQGVADDLAKRAASGEAVDVHEYMIAATSASVATELTVAMRNRAVEAFNSIMQMPV